MTSNLNPSAKRLRCFGAATVLTAAVACLTLAGSAAPVLPNINTNNIITITNAPYYAVGDGVTDNTLAISNAILAAAAGGNVSGFWGGTVRVPGPGTFLCGPLTLKNNVNFQIDAGATVQMQPISVWTNLAAQSETYGNLLYASGAMNLEISGSGKIDGNGAGWWVSTGNVYDNRPYMIFFNGNCGRILIQNVTLQNPPKMHIVFKGSENNITVQGITINTTAPNAANTDGIDLVGTNCLIQNSIINAGDDNIALGTSSSSAVSAEILITNCTFGVGHGVSIGSNTAGAVSNLTVVNCTFNGTEYGIRMKSDDATSGGSGEGGLAQNLNYFNLGMTNIADGAIVIYSYYNEYGTPTDITPLMASTQAVAATTVPVWRNIIISNLNASVASDGVPGIIWGRLEVPVTNLLMDRVNISGPRPFDVYNASGVQFVDCRLTPPAGTNSFLVFNARMVISNSVPTNTLFTFDGLTTNVAGSVLSGNTLSLFNANASLKDTNVFPTGPISLNASELAVSNNLALSAATVLDYALGGGSATINVFGNLAMGGTINVTTNGSILVPGTNTLLTYTGTLSGSLPTLGLTPAGFNWALDASTAGRIDLLVTSPEPPAPTNVVATPANLQINLSWNAVPGATSYQLSRGTSNNGPYPTVFSGLSTTNYSDADVTNGVTYYYVVTDSASGIESSNSVQVSAAPLPSNQPTNILAQVGGGLLQVSWPRDHLGWSLQIQTNSLNSGLGTNWTIVPDSNTTNQISLPIDPANPAVFLRLISP